MSAPAWDTEWAAERAAEAIRFLAEQYPECGGWEELHPHQDAAHAAAVAGDREAYLQALRRYMRAGRGAQAGTACSPSRRNPVRGAQGMMLGGGGPGPGMRNALGP